MALRKEEGARRGVGEVAQLVADLDHAKAVRREAAVARLRILGPRATAPLVALISSAASSRARAGALRALEGLDDTKALSAAGTAAADPDSAVATAAIGTLRGWLPGESGTGVFDLLAGVALDSSRDSTVRLAALDALSDLPREVVQPLQQRIADGDPAMALDDPVAALDWLSSHAHPSLSALHSLVASLRDRERHETAARVRQEWLLARAAAHAALARRHSRVALYDLRESFETAQGPLPLDFLLAMSLIGDTSCLEPLARAWSASPQEPWWRERLQTAAREIVAREKLTGRHVMLKRMRAKYPGFA